MERRSRRNLLMALGGVVVIGVALVLLVPPMQAVMTGNYPIRFYGRVVDANGNPTPGVTVRFYVAYHTGRERAPSWSSETSKKYSVVTDKDGDFKLTGVYGYKFGIEDFSISGASMDWAFSPRDPRSPTMSFMYNERTSAATIPDEPARRLIYHLQPHVVRQHRTPSTSRMTNDQ